MKPWHAVAILLVGYAIGSYYGFAKLKALVSSATGA